MATIHVDVVSAEESIFSGEFGELQRHAPYMSTVRDGNLSIYKTDKGEPETIRIEGGFAEVNAKGLTVLAEKVEG